MQYHYVKQIFIFMYCFRIKERFLCWIHLVLILRLNPVGSSVQEMVYNWVSQHEREI